MRTNDAQAAVWVAQHAYDARDLAAQEGLSFSVYTPEIESALLSHPTVQAELASQATHIADLLKCPDAALRIANRSRGGQHV